MLLKRYCSNVRIAWWDFLLAFDKLGNALTGGDPQETISSRLAKMRRNDFGPFWKEISAPLRWFVDFVARVVFRQTRHTEKSLIESEGSDDLINKA